MFQVGDEVISEGFYGIGKVVSITGYEKNLLGEKCPIIVNNPSGCYYSYTKDGFLCGAYEEHLKEKYKIKKWSML